jgi:hypothetical protein
MQIAAFNAHCPFEIGDRVIAVETATGEEQGKGIVFRRGKERTITDIVCIHYLKAGRVEFRYELDNSGQYVEIAVQMPNCTEIAISCGPYPINKEDIKKIFREK